MIYLTGSTNYRDEPALIAAGIGLIIQPANSYSKWVGRYPYWAADNGCFKPETYIGDDAWLEWLDRLSREGCLFVVIPDVARRPDGQLGGDPVATWSKFRMLAPLVREMGFPVALAAQNGIESMPNLREQLEACDCLFIGGSDEWKVSDESASVVRLARSLGKWCHMGRVNSRKRMAQARLMGCQSGDGTFVKYRIRKKAEDREGDIDKRGASEIGGWITFLGDNKPLPFEVFEAPSLPVHLKAHIASQ